MPSWKIIMAVFTAMANISFAQTASGSNSAIQFYDSTGATPTSKFGWQGSPTAGKFFIETPNDGNGLSFQNGNLTVDGVIKGNKFEGDGSGLTGLGTLGPKPDAVATALKADVGFLNSVKGPKGDPGTPGAAGAQGIPGTPGTAGSQGLPGTPGLAGSNGIAGGNYINTTHGQQGYIIQTFWQSANINIVAPKAGYVLVFATADLIYYNSSGDSSSVLGIKYDLINSSLSPNESEVHRVILKHFNDEESISLNKGFPVEKGNNDFGLFYKFETPTGGRAIIEGISLSAVFFESKL